MLFGRRSVFALIACATLALLLLAGCATGKPTETPSSRELGQLMGTLDVASPGSARDEQVTLVEGRAEPGEPEIIRGTGRMVGSARPFSPPVSGDVVLSFEDAELRAVIETIFSEILGQSYLIVGDLSGRITLQTSRPLQRNAVLPMLERVLQMAGWAMVHSPSEDIYRIMSLDAAARAGHVIQAPRNVKAIRPGYQVAVIPLRYIAASEMAKILEPLLPPGATVRVDTPRNLLLLSATSSDVSIVMDNVDLFDVDMLAGLSVGMFPLANINPVVISGELEALFSAEAEGPLEGVLRFIPVERLGSVLVVTTQPAYLDQAEGWIRRLDRAKGNTSGRNLYVYRLQNTNAEEIAASLNQLYDFTLSRTGTRQPLDTPLADSLAPGQVGARLGRIEQETTSIQGRPRVGGSGIGGLAADDDDQSIRVVADTLKNALLILARPAEYEDLRRAIQALDIEPLQVLVDATIVEVRLTDELRYGLQWYFRGNIGGDLRGEGVLSSGDSGALGRAFPGFNYSVIDVDGMIRGVLSALAKDELVEVLSSPSLMVLDNHSAQLRIGDQIPIRTSESFSTLTETSRITSTIEYRDTGVLLTVTPRVNASGLVTMNIRQEVSDVTATTSSNIDSPTIIDRAINSTVAVRSGETIVLGGLIREFTGAQKGGVPLLKDIPLVGAAFSSTERVARRTELIVLLTPRVARDQDSARDITQEFRNRLERLQDAVNRAQPAGARTMTSISVPVVDQHPAALPTPARTDEMVAAQGLPEPDPVPIAEPQPVIRLEPMMEPRPELAATSPVKPDPAEVPEPPAPVTSASAQPVGNLPWLAIQEPAHFTIQLIAAQDHEQARNYVASRRVEDAQFAEIQSNGRAFVVAFVGAYPDRVAAERALARMPPELRAENPWIRTLGSVQDALR
jgi:general secretion pathway protein D